MTSSTTASVFPDLTGALHSDEPPLRALYVTYASLEDPMLWTQVVAYLAGLVQRGHTVHLLTFECRSDSNRRSSIEADLRDRGITWHVQRYHKRPSLPATVFDALIGALATARVVRRHRLDAIHARNHVAATMALIACRIVSCPLIFDLRGLMADEYVDAGLWKKGGIAYRLTEWVQRATLRRADAVTVRTDAVRRYLGLTGQEETAAVVIPACADLEQIGRHASERSSARAELGAEVRNVMVYVGKFTGWYMEREMADFYAVARRAYPDLLFLILTQADPGPMIAELSRCGVASEDYRVLQAAPEEVGRYLAAADFAISLIRPCLSKISASPTKVGEYLAAGLPVISSAGIGDLDGILQDNRVGVLVSDFSESSYEVAVRAIGELRRDPRTRDRCLAVAQKGFSLVDLGIPLYDALYRRVAPAHGG